MIKRITELGIDFDEKSKTSIRDIFDFIYDIRYPVYHEGIIRAKRKEDKRNPFYELSQNFTRHYLGKVDGDFAYGFSIYSNIRTMNILFEFIKENIEELYK